MSAWRRVRIRLLAEGTYAFTAKLHTSPYNEAGRGDAVREDGIVYGNVNEYGTEKRPANQRLETTLDGEPRPVDRARNAAEPRTFRNQSSETRP